jgi:hypothetical protein
MVHQQFADTIERVSKELFPELEWKEAGHSDSPLKVELMFMRSHVFKIAFEKHPEVFEGLNWVHDEEDSVPLWIRPGMDDDWAAHYLSNDDDDDYCDDDEDDLED